MSTPVKRRSIPLISREGSVRPHESWRARTPAARDVIAGLDRLDEARDVLGRVLEVAVHRDDDPAAGTGQPGVHRRVLARVPLEPHRAHARVAGVDRLEHREAAVGRSVVDVDHLVRAAESLERGREPPVQLVKRRALLEQRHDDGELGPWAGLGDALGHAQRLGHRRAERTPVGWREWPGRAVR